MQRKLAITLSLTAVLAGATPTIAQTKIRDLQQATSITLVGRVTQVYREDFVLEDATGQILVEAEPQSLQQAKLKLGDRVKVVGIYNDDSFAARQIQISDGEIIPVIDD